MTQTKHHRIQDDLRRHIRQLSTGDMLPTHTQMMKRYGAALGTVRQAVVQLQHEGLIRSRRGKGTFVVRRLNAKPIPTVAQKTIGLLVVRGGGASSTSLEELAMLQGAVESRGYRLEMRLTTRDDRSDVCAWAPGAVGLIVTGGSRCELLERLAAADHPIAFLGMTYEGRVPPTVSHVAWDIAGAVDTIAEHVFALGHHRVRLFNGSGTAYFDLVRERFMAAAERAGVGNTCDEVTFGSEPQRRAHVERMLNEPTPPTAVICENAEGACALIHHVQNAGWPVPQRLSVAAVAATSQLRVALPELTHVSMHIGAAFEKSLAALLTMIETGRLVHAEAPIRFRLGATCQSLRSPS